MFRNPMHRTILWVWMGWALIMVGFQIYVPHRFSLKRPDYAVSWTAPETVEGSQKGKIYLNEPYLNEHVAWDSEFYLAIATGGYEDPAIRRIGTTFVSGTEFLGYWPFVIPPYGDVIPGVSLSYAFFAFYPFVMRLAAYPLSLLGMNPIATSTLAGVVVSMLGTLAAMWALYEFGRTELGEEGGLRAAFYLIIFPSGFFLAQVYTEGLFVGLAFSSLVLLRKGHRGWAALLAVFATFTRAVGIALFIPLLLDWIREGEWRELDMEWRQIYYKGLPWRIIGRGLVVFAPVFAFLLWRISYYGMAFAKVEAEYFGRGLLSLGYSFVAWSEAFRALSGSNMQSASYYMIEWGAIVLSLVACIAGFRRHPDLAAFGLLVVVLSFTSGPAQGMHRYVLAAPPVFLFLSRLGNHRAFDRVWTLASILLMSTLTILFTFDMWTG